jgi:glycolate oxidase FAD binding subunit
VQANVAPSGTTRFVAAARHVDPLCSIQAHAANGIVIVRFADSPAEGMLRTAIDKLRVAARAACGNLIVLASPGTGALTRQDVWGASEAPVEMMTAVKREFDPKNLLNPGRFIYE